MENKLKLSALKLVFGRFVPYIVVVVLGATLAFGYFYGKSTERQAQELRTAQSLLRAAEEAERIREHDIKLIMEARDRETQIIERIRTVNVHVPTPDCTDLGAEWVREYNKAISAATDSRELSNPLP
jgi:hypothetical protein